ncbi:MAG: hypothetical protein Fur0022_20590 [Anaerolineales bacterium]
MMTYEFLSLLFGIFLRIAFPIGVTLLAVWLLRRLDAHWQKEALHQATYMGEMTIPLQILNCWDVHDCSPERKATCPAYLHPEVSCWEVHRVNGQLSEACQECAFRKMKASVVSK